MDVNISGERFFSLFEPLTRVWKLFSPNIWTALYTIAMLLVVLKVYLFILKFFRRNRLSRLKAKLEDIEEKKLEEHMVMYDEMRPSYVSPFIDPHQNSAM